MDTQKKAYFFAGIAILLWSTVATAFKITLRYIDYITLLFYSSIFSTIILFCVLLFQKKLNILKNQCKQDIFYSAKLGFLNPFFYYIVLFKAYSILPAQEAQPLNYTWPITLSVLSVPLLKQQLSRKAITAIFISFLGVVLISTQGNFNYLKFTNLKGDFLAVFSSLIWAFFWIYNIKDQRDTVVKLFLAFCFGCIYNALIYMVFITPQIPDLLPLIGTVYIGFFEMGVTFLFWLNALKYSKDSASVANLVYISPFLSLIFIHFIVGEKILLSSIIGLVLIVTGILIQTNKSKIRESEVASK